MSALLLYIVAITSIALWCVCEVMHNASDPWSWRSDVASIGSTVSMAVMLVAFVLLWTAV